MASHLLESINLRGVKRAYEDLHDDTTITYNNKKKMHRRSPLTISSICAINLLGAMTTPRNTNVPIYRSFLNGSLFDRNLLRKILEYMSARQTTQLVEPKSPPIPYRICSISVNPVNGDIWMIEQSRDHIYVYSQDFEEKARIKVHNDETNLYVVRHFEDGTVFVTSNDPFDDGSDAYVITMVQNGHKGYDQRLLFGNSEISPFELAITKDRKGRPLLALYHHEEFMISIYNLKGEVQHRFESGFGLCAVQRRLYMQTYTDKQIIEYNLDTKEPTRIDSKSTDKYYLISMGECVGVLNYDHYVLRIYRGSTLTNEIQLQPEMPQHFFIDPVVNPVFCLRSRRIYFNSWFGLNDFVLDL